MARYISERQLRFQIVEEYKSFREIADPDIRSKAWGFGSLEVHHNKIGQFELHPGVPDKVRSAFATAKNVLLYAWFSYDLYPVAELRVLITLELALRERIGEEGLQAIRQRDKEKGRSTGMQSYIHYAIKNGWIDNEDFSAWDRAPLYQAWQDQIEKAIRIMKERGVEEIDLDEVELETPEDNNFNFLNTLLLWTNKVRNGHAHGTRLSGALEVWSNFEMVAEFIDKIFLFEGQSASK